MKSVALHNLGCKVNAYELDVMQQFLQNKGYQIVDFHQKADVYIINTCTVTNIADRKSRQMIHRAKKQNPDAIVVAVGCYVQTAAQQIEKDPYIDLAIGNNRKKEIVTIVEEYLRRREEVREMGEPDQPDKTLSGTTIPDIAAEKEYEEMHLSKTAEHTRAYIKVQDGCNQFCTYCIIPFARGRVRSRAKEDVIREVTDLANNGYQEVVLTGIHLSSYGVDLEQEDLLSLILAVHEVEGIQRIRLGSLEPRIITEEFAKTIAALPKMCPHFHLSLQSGSDATLKRMNRKYDTARFMESVRLLREHFENVAITTDLITGFPQETEEEFSETLAFIRAVGFADMHIFPYSIRPGTPAAKMEQIEKSVKEERAARAAAVAAEMHKEYLLSCIGQRFEVLFEQEKGGRYLGHAPNYMPVSVEGADLHNKVLTVEITGLHGDGLSGTITEGGNV